MNRPMLFDEEEALRDESRCDAGPGPNVLTIDIDGWEGPLDLLLALAPDKTQFACVSIRP